MTTGHRRTMMRKNAEFRPVCTNWSQCRGKRTMTPTDQVNLRTKGKAATIDPGTTMIMRRGRRDIAEETVAARDIPQLRPRSPDIVVAGMTTEAPAVLDPVDGTCNAGSLRLRPVPESVVAKGDWWTIEIVYTLLFSFCYLYYFWHRNPTFLQVPRQALDQPLFISFQK